MSDAGRGGPPGADPPPPTEPALLRSYLLRRRLADRLDDARRGIAAQTGRVSESQWIEAVLETGLEHLPEVLDRLLPSPPVAAEGGGADAIRTGEPVAPGRHRADVVAGREDDGPGGDELLGAPEESPEGGGALLEAYEAAWRVGSAIARPVTLGGRQRRLAALLHEHGGRATIAFISGMGGGAGQGVCSICVGMAFAASHVGRTICVDAGTVDSLGWRVGRRSAAGLDDALHDAGRIASWEDMRAYTTRVDPGVEVLAGPLEHARLGPDDRATVHQLVSRHYSWILYDLGVDVEVPVVLEACDQVVVLTGSSVGSTEAAERTLSRLHERSAALAESATVVIDDVRDEVQVQVRLLAKYFQRHVREVVAIPHDRRLASSTHVEWATLQPRTRDAYLELAGVIAEGLGRGGASGRS